MKQELSFLLLVISCIATTSATVIIIGAGISGLGAARRLLESGFEDFIILEARNVVGGRMQGFPFAGYELQPGAAWIVGLNRDSSGGQNPMWEFAQQIGLDGTISDFDDQVVYDWEGNLQGDNLDRFWNEYEDANEKVEEFALTLDPTDNASYAISQGEVFRKLGYQLGQTGPELWTSNFVTWYSFDWNAALSPDGISALGYVPKITRDLWGLDSWYTRGGFGRIPEFIASQFMDKILFNTPVVSIEYAAGGGGRGVIVTTQSGAQYFGDQVISTVSAAVMKSDLIRWSPPLPIDKIDALERFKGTGLYNKLFMQFDSVFWDPNEYINFISERRGYHSVILNMNHANYEPDSRILLFKQVEGNAVQWQQESLQQSVDDAMVTLRLMYGETIPEPALATKVLWGIDPFFQMSYTSWPNAFSPNDYITMCSSVNNTLFFGGEACSSEFHGYTHGGYIRGITAAEEFLHSTGLLTETKLNPLWYNFPEDAAKYTKHKRRKHGH